METLFQIISRIEKSEKYTSQDQKNKAIKENFELWAKSNKIVEAVQNGKTTFLAEHQAQYAGINTADFFIPYTMNRNYLRGFRDLEACLGRTANMIEPAGFESLIANPVTFGLAGLYGGASIAMNRREFLSKIKPIVTGTGVGMAIGLFFPFLSLADAVNMQENARYLDQLYKRVYKIK